MWTNKKKNVKTPVIRCATHDHMPSRPRYSVPAGRVGRLAGGVVALPRAPVDTPRS
jgi:hypothetical protein